MQLPSNKIGGLLIAVVLVVVLVIVGDVILGKFGGKILPDYVDADIVIHRKTTDNSSSDSDGDGLLDWEESLWGTDPLKYDTDGDGTSDKDEINQNRDPLVPGPNDENIDLQDKLLSKIQERNLDEDGLTNKVANSFASTYFNSRSGGELTTDQKNNLVNF